MLHSGPFGVQEEEEMSKKFGLIAVCLLAGATPALAQTVCTEPAPPTMVDGNTATRDQMLAAVAGVKDFISKSDVYQTCIANDLDAKKKAAGTTPLDPGVQQVALAKVAANQAAKDKMAADINAQVKIFQAKPK
jgi:hypothetical protein